MILHLIEQSGGSVFYFILFIRTYLGVSIIKRCEIKIIVVTWRIASRRHTVQNHLFSSLPLTS